MLIIYIIQFFRFGCSVAYFSSTSVLAVGSPRDGLNLFFSIESLIRSSSVILSLDGIGNSYLDSGLSLKCVSCICSILNSLLRQLGAVYLLFISAQGTCLSFNKITFPCKS